MRKQFADIVFVVTNDVDKITEKGSTRPAGQIVHAFLRKRDLIKYDRILLTALLRQFKKLCSRNEKKEKERGIETMKERDRHLRTNFEVVALKIIYHDACRFERRSRVRHKYSRNRLRDF